ncbi:MAG: FAD-dependent oxidoreductase, partial [Pseudomonadota bacterium]
MGRTKSKKNRPHIAIIGAGISGLSAAAVLSRSMPVTVFERSSQPGGKIRTERIGNECIDAGPTVFTMAPIFEEIFVAAGGRLSDYLTLSKLDEIAKHFWSDGDRLSLFGQQSKNVEAIRQFSGARDALAYQKFMDKAKHSWETLYPRFLRGPTGSFLGMLAETNPLDLLRLDPYTTYWHSLSRIFDDPRLRQLFGRYSTYCGSSPFKASSTLSLISHVEQKGVWIIDGGMIALSNALETVASNNGAVFKYDADARILSNTSD